MAGHSKWKNIQARKGAQDIKRGKVFTKIIKEITVAAKAGGPDADSNPRLRAAILSAKSVNMPKDNIERAIKKASGSEADDYQEITYEGFGPDGVAIFVECATENNTRTVSNIRSYFGKHGGSIGKEGCLQYVFERKGIFSLPVKEIGDEESFTLEMIDAGASDVEVEDGTVIVSCAMEDFGKVQKKLVDMNLEPEESGLQRIPLDTKKVSVETFEKIMKLIERLEEDDDVQKVYHNMEYDEAFLGQLGS